MKRYKIGIMGGTFNPIHNGHILIAQAAYEYCSLDKVWFMPTGVSYLKEQSEILPAEHRLKMTELAIADYEYFEVSDFEVKREGNTYTADTLKALHALYPEYDFYFILGADSFVSIEKWKEVDAIMRLCTLVTVVRDDVDKENLLLQKENLQNKWQAKVILVPFAKTDISSSEIRKRLRQGLNVKEFVPAKVEAYMQSEKLYVEDDFLVSLDQKIRDAQTPSRYEHTIGVVKVAELLALQYGVELQKAKIAALLHDCAKCIPFEEQLSLCEKYQVPLRVMEKANTELLHSKLGAVLAKELYDICDTDILESIKNHTTGRPKMSTLEKIIFVADYIEPGRYKAENLPMIRKMAFENLDGAVQKILEDTLNYLKRTGCAIDESTVKTLEYYKK